MRIVKKLLAVVLATALIAGTMSMAFAALDNPIRAFSGRLRQASEGVSGVSSVTVTVAPATANVKQGGTQSFTAAVKVGTSSVTSPSIKWSVTPGVSSTTIEASTGNLTVGDTETVGKKLTVTATYTDEAKAAYTGTAIVTVVAKDAPDTETFAITFANPENGVLTATADSKTVNSGDKVEKDTIITFKVVPATGFVVDKWTGATVDSSNANTATLTVERDTAVGVTLVASELPPATESAVPTITKQPVGQKLNTGDKLELSVVAEASDNGTLSYQWFKGETEIAKATNATYTIANAAKTDAGSYKVVVTNTKDSLTSKSVTSDKCEVTVEDKAATDSAIPVIKTSWTADQALTTGDKLSLSVEATASDNGKLTYKWLKDDKVITGATGAAYTIATVAKTDAGSYKVEVTNTKDSLTPKSVTSEPCKVTVTDKAAPVYTVTIAETTHGTVVANPKTAKEGETVTLTVSPDKGYLTETVSVKKGTQTVAVKDNKFTMPDGDVTVTATFKEEPKKPDPTPDPEPSNPGGGGTGGGSGTNNDANAPATEEKVKDTVDAVKDLGNIANVAPDKLPAGVTVTKTADGGSIATIPVKLTSGDAGLKTDLMDTLGAGSSKVGLELTISSNSSSGSSSVKVVIPGGFGKITEPGRLSFPMDFKEKSDDAAKMLKDVKGTNAVSAAMQIGGNFNLPVAATITVKSTAAEGSTVHIYKYDPLTGKYTSIGQAKVVNGQLTFATKMMGQMLFTTGTI